MIDGFELETGQPVCEFEIQNTQANKLVTSPDHRFYAPSYSYVFAFDFYSKSQKAIQAIIAHEGNVTDLIMSNHTFFTCGDDKKVKIWDRRSAQSSATITTKNQNNAMVLLSDSNIIVVGDEAGYLSSYDIRNTNLLKSTKIDDGPIRCMSISPDDKQFIVSAQSGVTRSYTVSDTEPYKESFVIHAHNDYQLSCIYSPNGKLFATSAANNTARVWDAVNGDMKKNIVPSELREWIWGVAFSPDSSQLVVGGSDGICKKFDVENGRPLMNYPQIEKCISAIAIMKL